jgi:hypothetical protein
MTKNGTHKPIDMGIGQNYTTCYKLCLPKLSDRFAPMIY